MQSLSSLLVPAALSLMCQASGAAAPVPTPELLASPSTVSSPATIPQDPVNQEPRRRPNRQGRRGGRRFGRRGIVVIEAGMVHPVAGPPIKNGVVVINGERILAVGQQGELQLPPDTKVYKFPDGHVYPGLIDASTDAFTDAGLRRDRTLNGGSKISEGLLWTDSRDDKLIEHGVTTAYVTVKTGSQLPGQGAIVRPRKAGFDLWKGKEQAAVQLVMAQGQGATHALSRQSSLNGVGRIFDGLDKYTEAQEKYEKDLEKYNEDFEKYIAHHAKKNGKDTTEKKDDGKKPDTLKPSGAKPETAGPSGPSRRRRGGNRPPRGGGDGKEDLSAETVEKTVATIMALMGGTAENATETAQPQDPRRRGRPSGRPSRSGSSSSQAAQGKPSSSSEKKKDDGPKRPKYPKKPTKDLQKEALIKVLDGDLPLRIEAHRTDELFAALRLQRDKEIPLVVLERAYGAGSITKDLAEQGVTCVLTEVLPNSLGVPGDIRNPYSKFDPTALPKQLNDEGVPFAIASGRARLAGMLPMMAAAAVGRGLSEEAALRAITLTPAEILGVAKDTGSLARDKFADVIVTSGPLFKSDSRMLLVVAKGRTEYEAK